MYDFLPFFSWFPLIGVVLSKLGGVVFTVALLKSGFFVHIFFVGEPINLSFCGSSTTYDAGISALERGCIPKKEAPKIRLFFEKNMGLPLMTLSFRNPKVGGWAIVQKWLQKCSYFRGKHNSTNISKSGRNWTQFGSISRLYYHLF
jgi:hypothetical protein